MTTSAGVDIFRRMHIGRLRLAHQHIAGPAFDDADDVVRHHGAVQAQDFLGALWGLGLRSRHATEASVEGAITRRAIVRTWPMRGTLHFVAAEDARWMLRLLTPRVIAGAASRYRQLELDSAVLTRSARVAERALEGGKCVRRDGMYVLWNDAGITTDGSRGLHILGHLAQTGLLCFGPRDGKQHTITLLEEWLPSARRLERDEALGELARRYFTSHGPATVQDFAWWSGLTVTDARSGLESVQSELVRDDIDGRAVWFPPTPSTRGGRASAYLLPAWDEYTVAYRDRGDVLDARFATRVNAGGGVLKPVVVIGAQVVGTWQRTIAKGKVVVNPSVFRRLAHAEADALDAAIARYGAFLGLTAESSSSRGSRPRRGADATAGS